MSTGTTRRDVLKAGASLAAVTALGSGCGGSSSSGAGTVALERPDFLILLTDQERHHTHWPEGLLEQLMPSWQRLRANGQVFTRAYTAASQCSPSRACLWTGEYARTNGVPYLDVGQELPGADELPNIATFMRSAGYDVVYKGKWHLSFPQDFEGNKPTDEVWTEDDIQALHDRYGLDEWNPPDSGNSAFDSEEARRSWGGAIADNDGRTVAGVTGPDQEPGLGESVLDYVARVGSVPRAERNPFCLIVSLVNPHDIAFYPEGFDLGGYDLADFESLGVALPPNLNDPLDTKPSIQSRYRDALDAERSLDTPEAQSRYVNFYAYLHSVVEPHIQQVLDAFDQYGLTADTVIVRTADHGELGLSHGLTEKAYTAYEEMIHIPLVVSNPTLFAAPQSTDAFWSHVDLVATLAELAGAAPIGVGVSQVPVLLAPTTAVRDAVLFTYDDNFILKPDEPGALVRALREDRYTYATYFSADGSGFEFELYDNAEDPGQLTNLLFQPGEDRLALWRSLHARLTALMEDASAMPEGFIWPNDPTVV